MAPRNSETIQNAVKQHRKQCNSPGHSETVPDTVKQNQKHCNSTIHTATITWRSAQKSRTRSQLLQVRCGKTAGCAACCAAWPGAGGSSLACWSARIHRLWSGALYTASTIVSLPVRGSMCRSGCECMGRSAWGNVRVSV